MEVVELLLAQPEVDVNARNFHIEWPLFVAAGREDGENSARQGPGGQYMP